MWWWLSVALCGEAQLSVRALDFDLSADTERGVRRVLHRMVSTYRDELGLPLPDPTELDVRLVADREEYDRQARAVGLDQPTLGFFSSRLGYGVVWRNESTSQMQATIVHEASHYLMTLGGTARAPLWLHEGMAELFEGARTSGNAIYLDPPQGVGAWLQQRGPTLPPLGDLLGDPSLWDAQPETPVGPAPYGIGWSICAFLMSRPAGRETLAAILAATRGGDAARAATAADASWSGGLAGLDREWRAWWSRPLGSIQLPIPTDRAAATQGGWRARSDHRR